MNKPIDQISFWEERIERALRLNQIGLSVFETYDWPTINKAHREILDAHVPEGSKVLDAGCGYGRLLELLPRCRYTGVDFVPMFIELAEKMTVKDFPQSRHFYTYFLVADLESLPWDNKVFDWTVCSSMRAMVIGNRGQEVWDRMEKELKRVSRNLLILEYGSPEVYEVHPC